jgi:signal transduction histidine kinase
VAWVVVPVIILTLAWVYLAATDIAAAAGAGLGIAVVAVVLAAVFTRRLAGEAAALAAQARRVAQETAVTDGDAAPADSTGAVRTAEFAAVATALADIRQSAADAAAADAGLRSGLRQVFVSLGKRNQSLVHRQLRIIDKLEQEASGSTELGDLFALDHLTTRMRRHAESLTVLAGEAPGRPWSGPVPVIDVMRAAAAEVEDYKRVEVRSDAEQAIAAPAVTDMIHLLAELVENATLFSPSNTKVEVRAESVANGFVIEVEDRGLGIPRGQLQEINERLADPPDVDLADADRLGLFVAGKLAARHGVQVSLCPSPYRGTKAVVVLPGGIIVPDVQPGAAGRPDTAGRLDGDGQALRRFGRLNVRTPGVLAMAGSGTGPSPAEAAQARAAEAAASTAGTTEPPRAAGPAENAAPLPARRPGLPRRVRPDTEDSSSGHGGGPPARRPASGKVAPDSPLPEHARSLAASVQSSWRRSQQANDVPQARSEPDTGEAS